MRGEKVRTEGVDTGLHEWLVGRRSSAQDAGHHRLHTCQHYCLVHAGRRLVGLNLRSKEAASCTGQGSQQAGQ